MAADYLVSSLPPVPFDGPAPLGKEAFDDLVRQQLGDTAGNAAPRAAARWRDLETQLRNVVCEERAKARGLDAARWKRPADGCDVFWRERAKSAMQEKDAAKRETALDKLYWDAAESLIPPASPLSAAAVFAYGIKLEIARRRAARSQEEGRKVFDSFASAADIVLQ